MTIRRRSILIAIITAAAAVSASGIAAFFLIVPATSYINSSVGDTVAKGHEEVNGQTRSWIPVKDAAVLLQIGNVPEQQMIESGLGTSDQTTFLPISITYTMTFANPTRSFVFYPIDTALWKGWIDGRHTSTMVNGNNQTVPFGGSTRDSLGSVNATCTEPYYAKVDSGNGHSGLLINRTSKAVSSFIPWGTFTAMSFDNSISPMRDLPANLTRTGTFHLTETGAGIVPANYTGSSSLVNNLRGTGNDQVAGVYHLTFDTFYNNTTVQLPKSATSLSILKEVCTITRIPTPAAYSDAAPEWLFSRMYVYDIWFRMPN